MKSDYTILFPHQDTMGMLNLKVTLDELRIMYNLVNRLQPENQDERNIMYNLLNEIYACMLDLNDYQP